MRASSPIARLLVLGQVALWAGCLGDNLELAEGAACGGNIGMVCADGLSCQYGYCRRPCTQDTDCPHGGACIAALLQNEYRACTHAAPVICSDDDACTDGQVCTAWYHDDLEERLCAFGQELRCDETTCPGGASCMPIVHDVQRRVCSVPRDIGCLDGCDGGSRACWNGPDGGVCRELCDVGRPCAEGYQCVGAVCVGRR